MSTKLSTGHSSFFRNATNVLLLQPSIAKEGQTKFFEQARTQLLNGPKVQTVRGASVGTLHTSVASHSIAPPNLLQAAKQSRRTEQKTTNEQIRQAWHGLLQSSRLKRRAV